MVLDTCVQRSGLGTRIAHSLHEPFAELTQPPVQHLPSWLGIGISLLVEGRRLRRARRFEPDSLTGEKRMMPSPFQSIAEVMELQSAFCLRWDPLGLA